MKGNNTDKFLIKGLGSTRSLKGEVDIGGAKNDVLKIMAASILFEDDLVIENVPQVEDVLRMQELLENLGAKVENKKDGKLKINTAKIKKSDLDQEISKRMRASIALTGPVLARFGEVHFPHPGGCVLGERPIDMFLDTYSMMGANHRRDKDGTYHVEAPKGVRHAKIFFDKQSVGATETSLMMSILADGETVLKNVALEPEIINIANFFKDCGANIEGLRTTTIKIVGGEMLKTEGRVYKVIPDRLEAGSFLILGALTSNNLLIKNCAPKHLEAVTHSLKKAGVKMEIGKDFIKVLENNTKNFTGVNIKTHEYPGFPTDLQAPMTVFLTQASGESEVHETIFENRFGFAEDLNKMGANIQTWNPQKISIEGPAKLKHSTLYGPDIRAGLAFMIAAIIAEGDSVIENAYYIDRGYEKIEEKLRKIGVSIKREN